MLYGLHRRERKEPNKPTVLPGESLFHKLTIAILTSADDPPMDPTDNSPLGHEEAILRHNVRVESFYSAFNGIYLGLALFAAPVVAVAALKANPLLLTILVSSFPVGAFLGPLWAIAGRRFGMKRLATWGTFLASLPLLSGFWIEDAWSFTTAMATSMVLISAIRMGQASLYRVVYPEAQRGRVLGRFTFWTYLTMVPSVLTTGWLLDKSAEMYRVVYPLAGLCGLISCVFYSMLIIPDAVPGRRQPATWLVKLRGVERVLRSDRAFRLFEIGFFLSGSSFFMSSHVVLILVSQRFEFTAFELSLWLSVVPQLLLALGSPLWGRILDRIGIIRCRLLISVMMTVYLASYFVGITTGVAMFIFVGSILQGLSNGGGQLTWYLASSHFAPSADEVPLYNGIHFVLNGVRGLGMPWVGSILYILSGPFAVLGATMVSLASIPANLRALGLPRLPPIHDDEPRIASLEVGQKPLAS
ncbi:MAG: hypothetical protein KatS3mg105_3115 [Gemmatales bacterium]|nr:MAG: hypothetical protein KatS3mg105_3115 [Gemmatales bacterium]